MPNWCTLFLASVGEHGRRAEVSLENTYERQRRSRRNYRIEYTGHVVYCGAAWKIK
jgi:hypothetical protein